ncbi:MAG: TetR/AcrR family transcriptional regulator [Porticoccaceae bacterium]
MPNKPKQQKGDKDGMQRILLAARNEFCRAGLSGAKLEVIALEAGVSKQLIHHYFRTKTELYAATVDDATRDVMAQLNGIDYEQCPPEEALTRFIHRLFHLLHEHPFVAGIFNDQNLRGGEHTSEQISRRPRLTMRLKEVLRRGQAEGVFRRDVDAHAILAAAVMIAMGCFTSREIMAAFVPVAFETPEDMARWRDLAVKVMLDQMLARP